MTGRRGDGGSSAAAAPDEASTSSSSRSIDMALPSIGGPTGRQWKGRGGTCASPSRRPLPPKGRAGVAKPLTRESVTRAVSAH